MLVRSYWTLCTATVLAAILLLVAGYFTPMVAIVFGFIAFGLTFMGMMGVLPSMISHPIELKPKMPAAFPAAEAREAPVHGLSVGVRTS
jgi:hypothetical protein